MKIWFCEDVGNCEQFFTREHGFGTTKEEAESFVSGNRGYDYYDGSGIAECIADGWAKEAVEVEMPDAIAKYLLACCTI